MKKNTFLFLAGCSIIIIIIILLNIRTETNENQQSLPFGPKASREEAQDLTLPGQEETTGGAIEREPPIPQGEPLLN